MKINAFYESMGLRIMPTRYEWQGENDHVVVMKLWNKPDELDWNGGRIRCLTLERPSADRGSRWDNRKSAIDDIRSGRKKGFFTLGEESHGKQVEYVNFSEERIYKVGEIQEAEDGSLWVHFDKSAFVHPREIRKLSDGGSTQL